MTPSHGSLSIRIVFRSYRAERPRLRQTVVRRERFDTRQRISCALNRLAISDRGFSLRLSRERAELVPDPLVYSWVHDTAQRHDQLTPISEGATHVPCSPPMADDFPHAPIIPGPCSPSAEGPLAIQPPQCPPHEQLEERAVPAAIPLMVTSPADSGPGTLRQAIIMAERPPAVNPNSYVITIKTPVPITLDSALPDLSRNITIQFLGAGTSTVQRDPSAPAFRIFTVDAGETVNISGLTIKGGNALTSGTGPLGNGGGIENFGTLTVSNSVFSSNAASNDGGGIENLGTATVSGSSFTGNSASGTFGGGGGLDNSGTLTISNSVFTSNSASGRGGGLDNESGGTATVSGSSFTSNSAAAGGGLDNGGTATVSGSTFTSNSAVNDGGGIDNFGTVTVSDSTFTGRTSASNGGDFFNESGGTVIDGGGNNIPL